MSVDFEKISEKDFPIDIVYLWCDSTDDVWRQKREAELKKYNKSLDNDTASECRFIDNDELKYSLRSLEKFAPWINNIFIVTDNQVPKWLDTTNSRIRVIDHRQILPTEALPTFNSMAIEAVLHKIPNLSEHFLVANDDTFFGKPVSKSFFFEEGTGLPIFRFSKRRIINKKYKHIFGYTISKAYNLVKSHFGKSCAYFPHHNIDAYRKSDCEKCYMEFKEGFDATIKHQFRNEEDLQRSVFAYYALANGLGKSKIVNNLWQKLTSRNGLDSIFLELKKSKFKLIEKYKPFLFCINDSLNTTDDDRMAMKEFLNSKFKEKSLFEKEQI